jgi:hypothetical protein
MRPQTPQDDIADHQRDQSRLRRLEQAEATLVGTIVLWRAGVAIPDGWLQCDGTAFSEVSYPQLSMLWSSTTLPADPGLTGYVAIVRAR